MSGMITNPPPNDSAPTLNATHATEARIPPPSAAGNSGAIPAAALGQRRARSASSNPPQPSRTRTSQGPIVAAAAPPASRYATQRRREARTGSRADARFQLGTSSDHPACTATAATAAPAPAPAPRTHSGGAPARNSAARTRMRISPGTMKASPPTTAPSLPRTRHAQKIASSVDAGPGSRLHAAMASSNSAASSHSRWSTHSLRSSAMWAGGPPNPVTPIRPHSRRTVPRPAVCSTASFNYTPFFPNERWCPPRSASSLPRRTVSTPGRTDTVSERPGAMTSPSTCLGRSIAALISTRRARNRSK